MIKRRFACFLLAALLLSSLSCTKIPEKMTGERGDIAMPAMPFADQIPVAWGKLVSVTTSADFGHIFQLWFEDEGGTIRVAFYNIRANTFQDKGLVIPRAEEGTQ